MKISTMFMIMLSLSMSIHQAFADSANLLRIGDHILIGSPISSNKVYHNGSEFKLTAPFTGTNIWSYCQLSNIYSQESIATYTSPAGYQREDAGQAKELTVLMVSNESSLVRAIVGSVDKREHKVALGFLNCDIGYFSEPTLDTIKDQFGAHIEIDMQNNMNEQQAEQLLNDAQRKANIIMNKSYFKSK